MKYLAIAGLLIYVTINTSAQTSETRYYKGMPMTDEVPKERAKYARTITTHPDGSITTEIRNLKKDLVENSQTLKGEEPVGIWIYLTGRGPAELDYNFPLEYSGENCPEELNIEDYFNDDAAAGYEAPDISTGQPFSEFVGKNLIYPAHARRMGIQGKIELIFDLTDDGVIKNIRVRKGVHVVLDKEAVRVLRKMKFSTPPKVNGQPRNLCGNVSVTFRLA